MGALQRERRVTIVVEPTRRAERVDAMAALARAASTPRRELVAMGIRMAARASALGCGEQHRWAGPAGYGCERRGSGGASHVSVTRETGNGAVRPRELEAKTSVRGDVDQGGPEAVHVVAVGATR